VDLRTGTAVCCASVMVEGDPISVVRLGGRFGGVAGRSALAGGAPGPRSRRPGRAGRRSARPARRSPRHGPPRAVGRMPLRAVPRELLEHGPTARDPRLGRVDFLVPPGDTVIESRGKVSGSR